MMKKITILTSVLALAACGGGSGGGGGSAHVVSSSGASSEITVPAGLRAAIGDTAQGSNSAITSMASEVIVSSKTNTALKRTPVSLEVDGVKFVSYRLDDIKLYAADAASTQDGYLQLGMDEDGRIDRVTMVVGGTGGDIARVSEDGLFNGPIFEYVADKVAFTVADTGQTESDLATLKHDNNLDDGKWVKEGTDWKYMEYGDEAVFRVADTGQNMDDLIALESEKTLSDGHWNRVDELMDVETYGKDIDGKGTALQYSDFGHFNPVYKEKLVELKSQDAEGNWTYAMQKEHSESEVEDLLGREDFQLFAGGYAISGTSMDEDRPTLTPDNGAEYKGMAIGRVYTSIQGNGANRADHFAANGITNTGNIEKDGHDISKMYSTKEATMTISQDGNTQTLYMPFYSNSDKEEDRFYDITIVKQGDNIKSFDFESGGPGKNDDSLIGAEYRKYEALDKEGDNYKYVDLDTASFNPGYYGVNTATEAAGTARLFSEQDFGDGTQREWEVQAAYGMKKQ